MTFEHRWTCWRCRIETTAADEACVGAPMYHCCQVVFAEADGGSLFDGSWGGSTRMLHTHKLGTFPDCWSCTFYETR